MGRWKVELLMVIAGLAFAGLLYGYLHGSFDRALEPVGLNFHECARNGLGATFCGHELAEQRERVERVHESVVRLQQATREASQ